MILSTIFLFLFYLVISPKNNLIYAGKLYKSRKHLNETILGNNRFEVEGFIELKRILQLNKFLKKHRRFFQRYGNNYKLSVSDALFEGVFSGYIERNCSWGLGCEPVAEQALRVIKSTPHKYVDGQLESDIENYIHIRDKMYEYASEVLNTTTSVTQYGEFFYFFPKKAQTELYMNDTAYILAPHSDCCGFKNGYPRPLILDRSHHHDVYRRYTAVLYIDVPDPSENAGGLLKFIDLPNRYKLPVVPSKMKIVKGKLHIDGGAFADKEAVFTTVVPSLGKLVIFHAYEDLHGVTTYTGDTDRFSLSMFMTDAQGMWEQQRFIMPKIELDDPDSIAHFYKESYEKAGVVKYGDEGSIEVKKDEVNSRTEEEIANKDPSPDNEIKPVQTHANTVDTIKSSTHRHDAAPGKGENKHSKHANNKGDKSRRALHNKVLHDAIPGQWYYT